MAVQHNHAEMEITSVQRQCEDVRTFELGGSAGARAGQFVMALIPGVSENPLTVAYDNPLRLTVKAVGDFTNRLFTMKEGDRLQITGPMGNGFADVIDADRPIYVVMGGCGAAGLPLLDREFRAAGSRLVYIIGARSESHIPEDVWNLDQYPVNIATEDGSFGVKGTVLDAIDDAFEGSAMENPQAIVCGPRKMLVAAGEKLLQNMKPEDIIVSLEPYMKCGRGVCGSCEMGGYHVCTDGPNFRYSDLMGAPDFRSHRRGKSGALEPL